MLQKEIHTILSRFKDALRVYEAAMGEETMWRTSFSPIIPTTV